jgi:CheY-like chemotaxis protein/anti-sigma regulatory factor (Ser/Thr protein kinase)
MGDRLRVLAVDDVPDNIDLIIEVLKDDYEIYAAINGQRAISIARSQPLDAIILDIMMPGMDGLEVCRQLKTDPLTEHIPIIFASGLDGEEDILRGMAMGAFYYLTKPVDFVQLKAVVASAIDHFHTYRMLERERSDVVNSFLLIDSGSFRFRTLEQASNLAVLVAKACPNPEQALLGLTELMVNAVEHGNLGISYAEKSELNLAGRWRQEVQRRLQLPENLEKYASLQLQRYDDRVEIYVEDQGEGFDWLGFLEMDLERAFDNHGRGIAMARVLSFSKLEYLGNGNRVRAVIEPDQG